MKSYDMRIAMGAIAVTLACPAAAQNPADRPLPSPTQAPKGKPYAPARTPGAERQLQPIPEPPPPPPGFELDPSLEPQVTIQRRGTETIEEFRIRGRLYMVKVTPAHGVPYFLIDEAGRGEFTRRDELDTRTRVPMWVIHTF